MTKFKKGDKVRVICTHEFVPYGTELTIKDGPIGCGAGGNYYFEERRGVILGDNLKLVTEASELTTKFNVGDVVVTLEECGWAKGGQGLMLAGAIGKVKAVEGDLLTVKFNKKQPKGDYTTKEARKNFVVRTSEVRLATAEEVATITKKKQRLTVGDYAEVIAKECAHKASVGDIVRIIKDAEDAQPYRCERVSDGKNVGWFCERELKHAEKPSQSDEVITFEGAQYRKVDRKAQAGDVFVINHNDGDLPTWFTVGKPYKAIAPTDSTEEVSVIADDGDDLHVYNDGLGRTTETIDVYEKVEAKQSSYVPREGDIVVVTDASGSTLAIGDVGKITVADTDGTFRVTVPNKRDAGNWMLPDEIRLATPAEVAQYEQAVTDASKPEVKAPALKAGDYVKFTENQIGIIGGDLYEIIERYEVIGLVDKDGDFRHGGVFGDEYEIVPADEAKWAKLGRTVNEFKKGDIVYATGKMMANRSELLNIAGQVEDVTHDAIGIRFFDRQYCGTYIKDGVVLVAPVDARFDK